MPRKEYPHLVALLNELTDSLRAVSELLEAREEEEDPGGMPSPELDAAKQLLARIDAE